MATENFFPTDPDGSTFITRDEAAGYVGWTYLAENLAAGYTTPTDVVNAWLADPAHLAILLSPTARDVGVGFAFQRGSTYGTYWVQELGALKQGLSPPLCQREFLPHVAR